MKMGKGFKRLLQKNDSVYNRLKKAYLLLNRRNQLCEVPIELCTNPMGFSFSGVGWNYLIEQLKEFDRCEEVQIRESVLYRYHQEYQPRDMSDLPLRAGYHVRFAPKLSIYPWGNFQKIDRWFNESGKNAYHSRFYGPSSLELVQKDIHNLTQLYQSIKTHGYNPWLFKNSFIGGVFLVRNSGEKKFVVLQGNHRTAILAHLGYKKFLARYLPGYLRYVRESEISDWVYVKTGQCGREDAYAYFNFFFEKDGSAMASQMGLLTHQACL